MAHALLSTKADEGKSRAGWLLDSCPDAWPQVSRRPASHKGGLLAGPSFPFSCTALGKCCPSAFLFDLFRGLLLCLSSLSILFPFLLLTAPLIINFAADWIWGNTSRALFVLPRERISGPFGGKLECKKQQLQWRYLYTKWLVTKNALIYSVIPFVDHRVADNTFNFNTLAEML